MDAPHTLFKNIWLVDDDLDDHLVFETALREVLPHATLHLFARCSELFLPLSITSPDLLFLDINLPEINGLRCLQNFRQITAAEKVPVIMSTGSSYAKDIMTSYDFGANLYLTKPPTHQKLVTALHQLFKMNWEDPQSITDRHFVGNRFVPFSAE